MRIYTNNLRVSTKLTNNTCQTRQGLNLSAYDMSFKASLPSPTKLKNSVFSGGKIAAFTDRASLQLRYLSEYISDIFLLEDSTIERVVMEENAALKLGTKANFGDNIRLAQSVNGIIQTLKQKGLKVPKNIWSYDLPFDPMDSSFLDTVEISEKYGAIYPGLSTITLNNGVSWGNLGLAMEKLHKDRVISTPDANHFIWHQFGHFLQDCYNHPKALAHDGIEFSKEESVNIEKKVSKTAAYCHNNFVAEVFAGKAAGKSYDTSIMEMFDSYGGVLLDR